MDTTTAKGRKSRKTTNLTTEQVIRKRATDRVSQRNCRARTKSHIQCLETKVTELTYLLSEANAEIRRLNDALQQLKDVSRSVTEDNHQTCAPLAIPLPAHDDLDTFAPSTVQETRPPLHVSVEGENTVEQGAFDPFKVAGGHATEQELDAGTLDFITEIPIHLFDWAECLGEFDCTVPIMAAPPFDLTLTRADNISNDLQHSTCDSDAGCTASRLSNNETPEWQRPLPHIAPVTRLDEIILDGSRTWRNRFLQTGRHNTELREARFPNISFLLNPSSCGEGDDNRRPLCKRLATHVLERSPLPDIAERIAFMYKVSHVLRWLVCQTKETYESMPEYLRPTRLQFTTPHPAWIDIITWPGVRDAVIKEMDWGRFESFRKLMGKSMSVNWPYPDSATFMESPDGNFLKLSPLFEAHIRSAENWKVGKEVADAFPFMKPYCR